MARDEQYNGWMNYAMSFIANVEWTEIAQHLLDDDRVEEEEE